MNRPNAEWAVTLPSTCCEQLRRSKEACGVFFHILCTFFPQKDFLLSLCIIAGHFCKEDGIKMACILFGS